MKYFVTIAIALSCSVTAFGQEKPPQLKDLRDKAGYSIGLGIGFSFQKQNTELKRLNTELNPDAFLNGIKDGMNSKPQMTQDQIQETMSAFEKEVQEKQEAVAKTNAAKSEKFLVENKTKEGVKTTDSGLQYKVLKEGTGAQPKATDTVTVNYRGTLIDGTEFDSSYKRGQPLTVAVTGGVIKGWTEALPTMKVGSKYQLFVPGNLAYGERGEPRAGIQPNSTLIFEVELLGIQGLPTPGTSPSPK
jgi:FKBP-type peptidyl-prolyl cis-trans isomerase FklB